MKRGDIVLVRQSRSPASKSRPCVVVQRDSALETGYKVTVCPLTSTLRGEAGQRPFVAPDALNGLRLPSEVQVDWIFTYPLDSVDSVIGRIDDPTLERIDAGIRNWLNL